MLHPRQILALLQSSARNRNASNGRQIHAHIIKSGLHQCAPLSNKLIHVYGRCGLLQESLRLFDEIPHRNAVSWDSILTAHIQSNLPGRALSIFPTMLAVDQILPDNYIFATIVKACANVPARKQGKQAHARFVLSPFADDPVVKSALVDMYAKCGLPDYAHCIFDSIPEKNSVCWTAMVSGYARNGRNSDAIELFRRMPFKDLFAWTALISGFVLSGDNVKALEWFVQMRSGIIQIVDPFILSAVIGASSNLAMLELGKQLHGLVIILGYKSSMVVGNALADMYAKCSDIVAAKNIFDEIDQRDIFSWTTMIVGLSQHGRAREALTLFSDMLLVGQKPNEVTFVGLICACSHAGFVEEGHLDEAANLIRTMPFEPDEAAWGALLSAWDKSHPMRDEILKLLRELSMEMKKRGYVPDASFVLHDLEQQEKEEQLFLHSERLAVALGLLKAVPGAPIRVVKNLRVCGDCHVVLKMVSDIVGREIVVRDANRPWQWPSQLVDGCRDLLDSEDNV
ncbi:hypothetical protein ACLOJK_022602 [Asimina triloba]